MSCILGVSATAIAAGFDYTCVLVTWGGVKCWGRNDYGQLGIGNTVQQNSPVDVSLGSGGHAPREVVLAHVQAPRPPQPRLLPSFIPCLPPAPPTGGRLLQCRHGNEPNVACACRA
jgi:hypothetical protein